MAPAPKRLGMPLGVSRGAKMLQQLGVKPPHVPAPAVVQHTKPGPEADVESVCSSIGPEALGLLNPDWVAEWVQQSGAQKSLPLTGQQLQGGRKLPSNRNPVFSQTPEVEQNLRPAGFQRKRKLIPPSNRDPPIVLKSLPLTEQNFKRPLIASRNLDTPTVLKSPSLLEQQLQEGRELPSNQTPVFAQTPEVVQNLRPDFQRNRKLIPPSNPDPQSVFKTTILSPARKVSCSVQIKPPEVASSSPMSHHTYTVAISPASSRSVSVSITVEEEAHVDSDTAPVATPVDDVVRDLFKAREAILAERRQQHTASESDSSDNDDSNYEPNSDSNQESDVDSNPGSAMDSEPLQYGSEGNGSAHTPEDDNHRDHGSGESNGSEHEPGNNGSEPEDNDADDDLDNDADDDLDNEDETPAPKRRKKQRIRQTTSSTRAERQRARNSGKAYVTESGKVRPQKVAAELPDCRKKCKLTLTDDVCKQLCEDYWSLGKLELRNSYLANLIEVTTKASQKLNLVSPERRRNRQYTMKYRVIKNGANVNVCQGCFLKIFQVTPKYIEKLSTAAGVLPPERRGQSNKTAVSGDRLENVLEHLRSFPRYKSHYARNKNNQNFLRSDLTIKAMYESYVEMYPTNPVSRWIYEREFHKMDLRIKPLKIDTCNKCDSLNMAVMYAKTNEDKVKARQLQELHHRKAEKARTQKQNDIDMLKNNPKKRMIAFDLQQCLPTPHLETSVVFYKRQLWVYNLTIHDCGSGKSTHNMWHEGEAERGPNEVGSALYKYLMNLPDTVEEVTLWSDTCGGQNKNSIICATLQTVLQRKLTLNIIDQKFLVSGHTYLDCDTDHSVIENKKRVAKNIHIPRDWFNLVANASKKFTVCHMEQSKQLNFKALLKGRESPLVKRKKNTDKDKFLWKNASWLRHSRKLPPGTMAYKETLDIDAQFYHLDLKRKKKGALLLDPPLSFDGPREIKQGKKTDLLKLLPLVDPECHQFYRDLRGDGEELDEEDDGAETDPDILPSTDEEESGDEF